MTIDWDEVTKGSQDFKDYAPNGEHTAKLESIKITDKEGWKSPAIDITWQEDDTYKYPRNARHWLSMANQTFRVRHVLEMLKEFGISEAQAKQAIEGAEKHEDRASLVKAYQAVFDKAASRHPEVEIVVQPQMRDGKPVLSDKGTPYSESEFKNPRLVIQGGKKEEKPLVVSPSSLDAEELTDESIPF